MPDFYVFSTPDSVSFRPKITLRAAAIVSLPPDQRMAKILAMPPEQLNAFRAEDSDVWYHVSFAVPFTVISPQCARMSS